MLPPTYVPVICVTRTGVNVTNSTQNHQETQLQLEKRLELMIPSL